MSEKYSLPSHIQTPWDSLTLQELTEDSAPQLVDLLRETDLSGLMMSGWDYRGINTSKPPSDVFKDYLEYNPGINYGIVDKDELVGIRCALPAKRGNVITGCFIGGGCHGQRYQTRSNILLQSIIPEGRCAILTVDATRNTPSLLSTVDSGADAIGWRRPAGRDSNVMVNFQMSPETFAKIEPAIISYGGVAEMIRRTKHDRRQAAWRRLIELGLSAKAVDRMIPLEAKS